MPAPNNLAICMACLEESSQEGNKCGVPSVEHVIPHLIVPAPFNFAICMACLGGTMVTMVTVKGISKNVRLLGCVCKTYKN